METSFHGDVVIKTCIRFLVKTVVGVGQGRGPRYSCVLFKFQMIIKCIVAWPFIKSDLLTMKSDIELSLAIKLRPLNFDAIKL